ncbi:MAG TPA: roadblock/LC7 domain-containing protein [Micromonospora sp.]
MSIGNSTEIALPRRVARTPADPARRVPLPRSLAGNRSLPYGAIDTELAELRVQVPGVTGCVLCGVDGLLVMDNLPAGSDPHDLAAMAATTFGLGRQVSLRLGQGQFRQSTVRNEHGYFSVYAVNDQALLAVVGTDAVNVARLHLYAPGVTERLAELLSAAPEA